MNIEFSAFTYIHRQVVLHQTLTPDRSQTGYRRHGQIQAGRRMLVWLRVCMVRLSMPRT